MGSLCSRVNPPPNPNIFVRRTYKLLNVSSALNNHGTGLCFGPKLGYDVPNYFAEAIKVSPAIIQAVQKGLIAILILHPIAAALATLSFISSLFLTSHAFSIVSLIITIVTALVSSIVLAIDIALVVVADSRVENMGDLRVNVGFGNAVWMILVAVALTWGAVISLSARACYCLGVRRYVHSLLVVRSRVKCLFLDTELATAIKARKRKAVMNRTGMKKSL